MADEPQVIDKPAPKEIIAPGYTFGTVTDQIAAVVLTKKTPPLFWMGSFAVGFGLLLLFLLAVGDTFARGLGRSGLLPPAPWAGARTPLLRRAGIGQRGSVVCRALSLPDHQ